MKNGFFKNKGILFVLGAVFLLMLALNGMTPLFADDYFYVLNLNTEEVLKNFPDILDSISNFRSMHNGRVAAHFFAQLFLWLPRAFFVVINAAMYTLLVYMTYLFVETDDKKKNNLLIFCAAAMLWVLMPGFGHGFLWLTGSCSYLWAITFIVMFIYPFYACYICGRGEKNNTVLNVLAIAYAFFAGAYSENGSFSAIAVAFCFIALIYIKDRKLPKQLTIRFFAACLGFLYLMLAPSELGKKNSDASGTITLLESLGLAGAKGLLLVFVGLVAVAVVLWGIFGRKRKFCRALAWLALTFVLALSICISAIECRGAENIIDAVNLIVSSVPLNLLLVFGIYFVFLMLAVSADVDIKIILTAIVFGLGAVASLVVFLVAIYFPARGACVAVVYLIVATLLLLREICFKTEKNLMKFFAAVVLVAFLPSLAAGVSDISHVYEQYQQRNLVVKQAQAVSAKELILDPIVCTGKYGVVWQGEYADYYYGMQAFYGIDRITIEGACEFGEEQ